MQESAPTGTEEKSRDFSWTVMKFTENGIDIQVNFEDSTTISTNGYPSDQMTIKFNENPATPGVPNFLTGVDDNGQRTKPDEEFLKDEQIMPIQ